VLGRLRKAGGPLNLDAWLQPAQRAEVAAFGLLIQAKLDPATLWTCWLERRGFGELRKVGQGGAGPRLRGRCRPALWPRRPIDALKRPAPSPPRRPQAAYSGSLPFPLNWLVPWSQQREMRRQLAGADGAAAYAGASDALLALADRLRASGGRFFFGDRPSSLDALLFGHAAFYLHSPIAAPVLRSKASRGGGCPRSGG
jgi:metaxin